MVQGCEETALAPIDAGCKVNLTTIRKGRGMQHMISLPCMAYRIRMHRVLKRLLYHPSCDFSQTDYSENNTIMHLAVRRGDMTLVDALLPKGLLLLTNRQGFTPLHLASHSGNVELMHTFFNQWRRENGVKWKTAGLEAVDNEAGVLEANTDSKALAQPLSNPLHTPNPGQVVSLALTGVGPAKAERNDSVLDMAFSYMATAHRHISVPTGEAFRTETRNSDSLRLTFSHHKQKTDKTVAGKVLDSWQPKENHNSSSSESLNAESKDGFLHSFTLPEEVEACLLSMPAEQVCETWTQWRQVGTGCCRKLVEHTATHTGNTMLHQAAKGAHVKFLKYLLAHGADVNNLSTRNKTPLMCLVSDVVSHVSGEGGGGSE
ncbi:uncharacterized protein [Littorina saxatilis]|uniref:uncharacterized protein n=1 Tax=Littorina saxatilis TaxID=31220 RepID=UPI0038B4A2F1